MTNRDVRRITAKVSEKAEKETRKVGRDCISSAKGLDVGNTQAKIVNI